MNSDRKTRSTTELVKSVFKYKTYKQLTDSVNTLFAARKNKIETQLSILQNVDPFIWPFFTEAEKSRYVQTYQTLQNDLNGEYGDDLARAINLANQVPTITDNEAWADFGRNPISYNTILEQLVPERFGGSGSYGLPKELVSEIEDECFFPDGLTTDLRRYQEWGVKYILHQKKVLLGDEMGLGKTVQAIATMVSLRNTGAKHFIVVCPASVLTNWCKEISKHSKLRSIQVYGQNRQDAFRLWKSTGGVAVTTYETLGRLRLETQFRYDLLVVDEAHYIKNPETARAQNVLRLRTNTDRVLFMTGTALENRVDEMITLIRMLQPQVAAAASRVAFMAKQKEFRDVVAPVYYRRKREDVIKELPELMESQEWCALTTQEEIEAYEEALYSRVYANIRRVSWNVQRLGNSSKAHRLKELIEEAEDEGRKVIVFSFFLDTINKLHTYLGERCYGPINGSTAPAKRQGIIDEFDEAPAGSVLLAQIIAGGTGLNIQSASVVIICEPQFKPSIENQAISRAYRMGQSRNVLVYRLLCEDTVDERLTDLLAQKQKIFNAFADESSAAKAAESDVEVDEKSFGEIINEEIERIKAKKGAGVEQIGDRL
ncbi:MAG: DEAD/DEAH box helicase [Lachnospiraceae bacterium]|nr:DEAD/DEAH box helicase [Lachnospiraceae bacterium]